MKNILTQITSSAALLASATLFVQSATATPVWVTWDISAGGNGHQYMAVPGYAGLTWNIANTEAQQAGGYLATITSQAENDFVFSLINSPAFFNGFNGAGPCIGGYQYDELDEPAGHWTWVTGEAWSYSNWYPGLPNNLPDGDDYLAFYSSIANTPAATWDDVHPNDPGAFGIGLGGYVVERVVPEPSSLSLVGLGSLLLFRARSKRR